MTNALHRTNAAIQGLKRNETINREAWCPTELVDHILPTIHTHSNFWNHSRPPTGSSEWITTYYTGEWLTSEPGLDIVFNGTDHYTIHLNTGIPARDLLAGIDNLVEVIITSNRLKIGWSVVHGKKTGQLKRELAAIDLNTDMEEEYREVFSKKMQRKQKSPNGTRNQAYALTDCPKREEDFGLQSTKVEFTPIKWTRERNKINYAPIYHPLDDAMPPLQVLDIPFPKSQVVDLTARKDLVIAPSRIGSGRGVYTLGNIPSGAVLMDYVDEAQEVISKKDICEGNRDTTFMYANHKTNTYINASNNTHSYCGLVNEALEDRNFNAIICESRDRNGRVRVYYMSTRDI